MLNFTSEVFGRSRRWSPILVATTLIAGVSQSSMAQQAGVPEGTKSEAALTGSIGPGKIIEAPSSENSYTPSPAQILAHERLMDAKARHLAPPLGPHTTALQTGRAGGPPVSSLVQQAPSTFTVFKGSLINSTCSGCGQSVVNEPSAANSGAFVVETSNWNIAYTTYGAAANIVWQNQNPYALSPGYCCDGKVIYDAGRDSFIMLLLDYAGEGASSNGFTLSITRGYKPTSWCTYKFTGANFGEGATDTLDFPKITVANNNLYVTWNDYPPNSGFRASGLARMPLDSLAACAGFSYNYLLRSDVFTLALAESPSAHDQFYFVSNWFLDGTVSGRNERIFWWPENSGTYFAATVGINPYTFG
jgi:hypothetical protein